ncbi:DEAD/DEAH box helicase [Kangiella shandongensis]|uniref:DEAD/DEAH box helicase n=1 Tax=Kangiella shandongensis TaxID=2763258 RepID=UPI001CBDA30E|nr:DEAD/DEAH box helicase [Kangiella shandongensis]
MDKRQKTIDVVNKLHRYQDGEIDSPEMIQSVCSYFDLIKSSDLSGSDLKFLKKISNVVGIPHYFDHLSNFQKGNLSIEDYTLSDLSSQIYESTLHTSDESKLHRYQKEILSLFNKEKMNRYFVSASTSFGKTFLVYEVIKKMNYRNIVLIFPTIALLSENLERLNSNDFFSAYKIHTLSDVESEELGSDNIFIYTPERFLSFLEKHENKPEFDFIFIDEVYKIDNEYIIDEDEKRENERDVSYRIAAYYSVMDSADIFLAGPYIERYSPSFERFLQDNRIIKCDFNEYEIVGKSYHEIKSAKRIAIEDDMVVEFSDEESGKGDRLKKLVYILSSTGRRDGCIVYCSTPPYAEDYAKNLPSLLTFENSTEDYKIFVEHVAKEYGEDWVVTQCLKKGVGVHHGLIPKYIQKEIISFFNAGTIRALTSTTTITEGVNTSAKSLIITNNKKGNKPLKRFDAKNIAGRAGRFEKHYKGFVIVLKNKFMDDINAEKESIHHKNYDLNSRKDEIDLFYSDDEFLSTEDKSKRENIKLKQKERGIPDSVLSMFKVVSRSDKIEVYDRISVLSQSEHTQLRALVQKVNNPSHMGIDWDGLQIVLDCISPVKNYQLNSAIVQKTNRGDGDHSILVPIIHNYLEQGFKGLVDFRKNNKNENTDQATRNTARFVYNTAKYQLVKYFGVFNVMYKFYRSQFQNLEIDEVSGIDRLLTKLEYNALTDVGRKVSDYGVPSKVLLYYENQQSKTVRSSFDDFEMRSFNSVDSIFNK